MSVNLKSIKKQLMDKYSFFGSIIDGMEYFETPNCVSNGIPTAGTDGKTIFYHPDVAIFHVLWSFPSPLFL